MSATAVQRAFRLRFNIQPPRKSICRWNHQFEQIGCLCPSFCITLYLFSTLYSEINLAEVPSINEGIRLLQLSYNVYIYMQASYVHF